MKYFPKFNGYYCISLSLFKMMIYIWFFLQGVQVTGLERAWRRRVDNGRLF